MTTKNLVVTDYKLRNYIIEQQYAPLQASGWNYITLLTGKSWSGANNIGFKKTISEGKSATNAYTFTKYYKGVDHKLMKLVRYHPNYSINGWRRDTYWRHTTVLWGGSNTFDPTIVASLTNAASATVWNKYAEETSYVNMFAFLGELRSTVRMLRHPAETLAKLIQTYTETVALQRTRFSKRREHILRIRPRTNGHVARKQRMIAKLQKQERQVFTKLWLQFQFGVKPLAGDIARAAGAIYDYSNEFSAPDRKSIRSTKTMEGVRSAELDNNTLEFNWAITQRNSFTRDAKVKLLMVYDIQKTFQAGTPLDTLKSRFSFGFAQLVPALWDLAPLSVFVDYFVNINDVLTAVAAVRPVIVRSDKYVFERVVGHAEAWSRGNVSGGFKDLTRPSDSIAESTVSLVRYTRGNWDGAIPALSFSFPIDKPLKLGNLFAFVNNAI